MEAKKKIKSFADLDVYQRTYSAGIEVMNKIVSKLPDSEKRDLKDQLSRSCKAIPRLIAEGCAKRHQKRGFQKYLDDYADDPILTSAAYSGLGACYEQQGKFLEAAQSYQNGANKFADHYNAPQQLMDAGRCFKLENRVADARKCYQTLIEEYPDSAFKSDAELFLATIKG